MKRLTTIILFTICFLAIGSWSYAQGKGCGHGCGKRAAASDTGGGVNYVDKDGDGICDNAGSLGAGKGQGKGCRGCGKNPGNGSQQGRNYVDKDGNGICDNLEQTQDKAE